MPQALRVVGEEIVEHFMIKDTLTGCVYCSLCCEPTPVNYRDASVPPHSEDCIIGKLQRALEVQD